MCNVIIEKKKLINNFAVCDGYEYHYVEINYGCCLEPASGQGYAGCTVRLSSWCPGGRDLWPSVTHSDDKITPLKSAV